MSSSSTIMLTVQNTTAIPQPVSVFNPLPSQASNGVGSGNSVQNSYTYNIELELSNSILNGFQYVTIIYSINGGVYQEATVNYGKPIASQQDLVNALNMFKQSVFFIKSSDPESLSVSSYSIAPDGNNYYYSLISCNNNYTTNSFTGSNTYGTLGSIIYNTGYANNGVGTLNRINTGNTFWINSIPNTTDSAFNRAGVSSSNIPNQISSVGMYANVYSSSNKQVYIGIASHSPSNPQIYVNNSLIVNFGNSQATLASSINSQLGTSTTTPLSDFWSIYPINLIQGNNLIFIDNLSHRPTIFPPVYVAPIPFAFEVYDNTAAEIAAATSYSGLNLLFSSKDYTQNMV